MRLIHSIKFINDSCNYLNIDLLDVNGFEIMNFIVFDLKDDLIIRSEEYIEIKHMINGNGNDYILLITKESELKNINIKFHGNIHGPQSSHTININIPELYNEDFIKNLYNEIQEIFI